jgi:bacterioferritin
MKAIDSEVTAYLNSVLRNELTAINQYFLHAKILEDWGILRLAGLVRAESIDEMKHADALMERILFLDGLPNMQDLGKLYIGQTAKEILECDLKLEMEALPVLREAVGHCEKVGDFVSRALFRDILVAEEDHVDWIETQLALVDKTGLENYIQAQMHE